MKTKIIIAVALYAATSFLSCTPEIMKVTITKNGASVSTIMPYDLKYKRSLKDSANVKVEVVKN